MRHPLMRIVLVISLVVFVCVSVLSNEALAEDRSRLVVQVASEIHTYDGLYHEAPGIVGAKDDGSVDVRGIDGNTYTIRGLSTRGSARRPADSMARVSVEGNARVYDESGADVTNRFVIEVITGSLEIRPRDLWLESANVKRAFNGKTLKNGKKKLLREDGFLEGDGASYEFFGEQLYPGSCDNDFKVTFDEGTDGSCYSVHKETGTLTVSDRKSSKRYEARVEGLSQTVACDGVAHSLSAIDGKDVRVEAGGIDYVIVGLTCETAHGTESGEYESAIERGDGFGIYMASDKAREHDVSNQFDLTLVPGKLVITPSDRYVATFFGSDSDWTDSLFVSDDGKEFHKIGEVPLEQRDPCIMWHSGAFWCVTCQNDADGYVWLNVCASANLVDWTRPARCGPFTLDSLPDVGGENFDVVAPEWFQDVDGSIRVIISCGWWGGNHGAPTDDHMQAYMLDVAYLGIADGRCQLTSNGPFQKLSLNADGADRIDGTIDVVDGRYYMTIKRNGLYMELWSNEVCAASGWRRVRDKCLYGFEAPCVYKTGQKWCMFADGVPEIEPYGVRRWEADSLLGDWKEQPVRFIDVDGTEIGTVRHGTVLPVRFGSEQAAWDAIDALT